MKKLFQLSLLILLGMVMMSCKKNNVKELKHIEFKNSADIKTLNVVNYPSSIKNTKKIEHTIVSEINTFSLKIIKNNFQEQTNHILSPIGLYMALSMLVEGTASTTSAELENLLGLKRDKLKEQMKIIYENDYYSNQDGRLYLANSVWVKKGLKINTDYINTLKDNYYAQCYEVNFSKSKGKEKIIKWLNHYTEDLLKLNKNNYNIDNNLAILLLNTIYFDNKWQIAFNKDNTIKDYFYVDNKRIDTDYMNHQISTFYKKTEEYIALVDYFENNNSITYIMPTIGFDKLLNKDLTEFTNNLEEAEINLFVPKFEYTKEYNLNETLYNLGVKKIFENDSLNRIGKDLYVSYIKQNVGIKLNEEGVKAAAATSIGIMKSSLPLESREVKLNKPFLYIIRDANNVILFIGILNNPTA